MIRAKIALAFCVIAALFLTSCAQTDLLNTSKYTSHPIERTDEISGNSPKTSVVLEGTPGKAASKPSDRNKIVTYDGQPGLFPAPFITVRPPQSSETPLTDDDTLGFDGGGARGASRLEAFGEPRIVDPVSAKGNPNYHVVRIFFGTNRTIVRKGRLNVALAQINNEMSYGYADVSIPNIHRIGEIESPSFSFREMSASTDRHVVLRGIWRLKRADWRRDLSSHAQGTDTRAALVYFHGYANSFDDAAMRTAQLKHDIGFHGPAAFFSWPSSGWRSPRGYTFDQTSADQSAPSAVTFLKEIAAIDGVEEIILIAHSTGARIATQALARLRTDPSWGQRQIGEVILAAPDIDRRVFVDQIMPAVRALSGKVTLYAAKDDWALWASSLLHGFERVGSVHPNPFVADGIETVDVSAIDATWWGHSHYAVSRTILTDIGHLVRSRLPAGKRLHLRPVQSGRLRYWKFLP